MLTGLCCHLYKPSDAPGTKVLRMNFYPILFFIYFSFQHAVPVPKSFTLQGPGRLGAHDLRCLPGPGRFGAPEPSYFTGSGAPRGAQTMYFTRSGAFDGVGARSVYLGLGMERLGTALGGLARPGRAPLIFASLELKVFLTLAELGVGGFTVPLVRCCVLLAWRWFPTAPFPAPRCAG